MNRTTKSALAIAITLGIGVPLWYFGIAVEHEPPTVPPRDLGPVPVSVVAVEPRSLAIEVVAYGNLRARERVVVSSEVSGRIDGVHPGWRPGAHFAANDELVRLDRETAGLDVLAARASRDETGAAVTSAEIELERAHRTLRNAEEQETVAAREHERARAMVETGATSESQLDRALAAKLDAELARETASGALRAAEAALAEHTGTEVDYAVNVWWRTW